MSDCIQGVINSLLDGCFGLEDAASDCAAVVFQQRQQLEDYREEVRELKAQLAETQALLPTWQAADFASRPVSHVRAFPELVLGDLARRSGNDVYSAGWVLSLARRGGRYPAEQRRREREQRRDAYMRDWIMAREIGLPSERDESDE